MASNGKLTTDAANKCRHRNKKHFEELSNLLCESLCHTNHQLNVAELVVCAVKEYVQKLAKTNPAVEDNPRRARRFPPEWYKKTCGLSHREIMAKQRTEAIADEVIEIAETVEASR